MKVATWAYSTEIKHFYKALRRTPASGAGKAKERVSREKPSPTQIEIIAPWEAGALAPASAAA